jgi:hypothetical protein
MTRYRLQIIIYLSALLLALGVFLPLTTMPLIGEVSYFRGANVEACLVVIFALCAPALMLSGKQRLCLLPVIGVWGVLLFPAFRDFLRSRNASSLQQLGNGVSSAMADFTADLFLNITDFHWGGLVFLLALLAFTLSSVLYQWKL